MTRKLVLLGWCLLVLAGCSRKSPLPGAAGPGSGGQASAHVPQPAEWPAWNPHASGQPVHPGLLKTAPQLGDQLLKGRDPTTVSKAAVALGEMGDKGYPYLYKGLTSNDESVRIVSLQSMPSTELVKNQREMMALMVRFLGDPNPDVRKAAVGRLTYFGKAAAQFTPMVRAMSVNDPDGSVRAAAATAALGLHEAATGVKITSATGDPFAK